MNNTETEIVKLFIEELREISRIVAYTKYYAILLEKDNEKKDKFLSIINRYREKIDFEITECNDSLINYHYILKFKTVFSKQEKTAKEIGSDLERRYQCVTIRYNDDFRFLIVEEYENLSLFKIVSVLNSHPEIKDCHIDDLGNLIIEVKEVTE